MAERGIGPQGRWAMAMVLLALTATEAGAQTAPAEQAPADSSGIEWSFRPVEAPRPAAATLEARWAAPFAVQSRGRVAERVERRVVVLRDSAEARRVAATEVAQGGAAAEVAVGPGSGAVRAGGSAAAAPTGGAAAGATPRPVAAGGASAGGGGGAATTATTAAASRGASAPDPAPATPRASPPAASGAARTHRVEYGETWYGIARQYRVPAARLAAANPEVDPERLRSGTVLRIPASETAAPAAASPAPARRTHTVTRGDTLFGIARRYGVTPAAIRASNRMTDDVVRLGQTLVIPPEERS